MDWYFFYELKLLELMFWKNRGSLSGRNNTQALEPLKCLWKKFILNNHMVLLVLTFQIMFSSLKGTLWFTVDPQFCPFSTCL